MKFNYYISNFINLTFVKVLSSDGISKPNTHNFNLFTSLLDKNQFKITVYFGFLSYQEPYSNSFSNQSPHAKENYGSFFAYYLDEKLNFLLIPDTHRLFDGNQYNSYHINQQKDSQQCQTTHIFLINPLLLYPQRRTSFNTQ